LSTYGNINLNGSSAMTGNTAVAGGGIENEYGTVTLNGSSSVTYNTGTVGTGGGIRSVGTGNTVNACTTWTGAISPNTPDDPPPLTTVSC
jgi:hypothetical protein